MRLTRERCSEHAPPSPRASCDSRIENFVFALAAEIRGEVGNVQLYAISRGGELTQFKEVAFDGKGDLPSDGALSNPADLPLVTGLQDQMISVYGNVIVRKQCAAAGKEGQVVLTDKMIRAEHVPAHCFYYLHVTKRVTWSEHVTHITCAVI